MASDADISFRFQLVVFDALLFRWCVSVLSWCADRAFVLVEC